MAYTNKTFNHKHAVADKHSKNLQQAEFLDETTKIHIFDVQIPMPGSNHHSQ